MCLCYAAPMQRRDETVTTATRTPSLCYQHTLTLALRLRLWHMRHAAAVYLLLL